MFFSSTTFIGIDPTAGERPFVYSAIDHELKLLALGHGTMQDVLAFCAGQQRALVAVCAPRQPNQGIMTNEEIRKKLRPQPKPGRWLNTRLVDYLLLGLNIRTPQTPAKARDCPRWMQNGFLLYKRLSTLGYQSFPVEGIDCQFIEVYPHASFSVLLDVKPFSKISLEGRIQRQLVLYELGLNISDPLRIFEEITRYKILSGVLPLDDLCSAGELDALIAAYSAWKVVSSPDEVSFLGDVNEGQIVLPKSPLKSRYG